MGPLPLPLVRGGREDPTARNDDGDGDGDTVRHDWRFLWATRVRGMGGAVCPG